jgi:DNA polymerase III delta' subunit
MLTAELIGHELIMNYLLKSFNLGKVNHAYLLLGPAQVGKSSLVRKLLLYVYCEHKSACGKCAACQQVTLASHPDVWWLERHEDKQAITIDQVRELQQFIGLRSLNGGLRVVVIDKAHELNLEAANALLKSLEEPAAGVSFFLISSEPKKILPTIRSRCFVLQFGLVDKATIAEYLKKQGFSLTAARELALLAGGRPGLALQYAHSPDLFKQEQVYLAMFWQLIQGVGFKEFVKFVERDITESTETDQAARHRALKLISCWQRLARDLILYKLGLNNHLVYTGQTNQFNAQAPRSLTELLQISLLLQKTADRLSANAHIKLTLEAAAFQLSVLAAH